MYVNPAFDVDAVVDSVITDLEGLTEDAGRPLFDAVHRAEDVYEGPYVGKGPEVIIEQAPGVHVNDGLGGGEVTSTPDRWAAENTRSDTFVADGPDFEARGHLDEISITDIAPTVLSAHGLSVPTDLDGKVLLIVPRDAGTRPPIEMDTVSCEDHGDAVEDRLKQLSYME